MTSKLAEKPKNEKWHVAISRGMLERWASDTFHFALLLMAWKESVNLLWQLYLQMRVNRMVFETLVRKRHSTEQPREIRNMDRK